MSIAGGEAELQRMIARLRQVGGEQLVRSAAVEAAPLVEQASKATAAAGVTPAGQAWAPRKKDGGRALAHAADKVTARPIGDLVLIALGFPESIHQRSKAYPRQVIPEGGGTGKLPAQLAAACLEGARRAFRKLMGGAV